MKKEMEHLRTLLAMPAAEVRSRKNAWEEVQLAGAALFAAIPPTLLNFIGADLSAPGAQDMSVLALVDAQRNGQASPIVRTVAIVPRTADMEDLVAAMRGEEG